MPKIEHVGLTSDQVQSFIDDGFVKIENAFSVDLAKQCRDELWADIGLSPDEPEKWVHPVVRVGFKSSRPFIEAAKTPRLHQAYNQLAGEGRWLAPKGLGTFPIRFPSPETPGDDGWHVDMSLGTDNPDFMVWRANVKSSGRAFADAVPVFGRRPGRCTYENSKGFPCPHRTGITPPWRSGRNAQTIVCQWLRLHGGL